MEGWFCEDEGRAGLWLARRIGRLKRGEIKRIKFVFLGRKPFSHGKIFDFLAKNFSVFPKVLSCLSNDSAKALAC
jgi:hypothetical protein